MEEPYVKTGAKYMLKISFVCVFLKLPLKMFFKDQNFFQDSVILLFTSFSILFSKDETLPIRLKIF